MHACALLCVQRQKQKHKNAVTRIALFVFVRVFRIAKVEERSSSNEASKSRYERWTQRERKRESKTTIQSSADSKLREINKRCSLLRLLFKYSFKYEGTLEIFRGVSYFFSVKQKDLKKNYCSTINRHAICLFSLEQIFLKNSRWRFTITFECTNFQWYKWSRNEINFSKY